MVDRRQYDFGRKRQRRHDCPGRNGAVIGPVGHSARQVVKELPLDTVDLDGVRPGAIARGDPPATPAVALELERIVDRVLLLHIGGAAAVLEVIDAFVAHEHVLDAAKIDPDVRQLMREQRSGVKIVVSVTVLPSISRTPRGVAAVGQRIRGRAERKHVEQQRFVVTLPTILEKAAFGFPAVCQRCALVLGPVPVGAAIERVGERADLLLVGRIRVEILRRRQHSGQQKSAVYGRQLALPGTPPGPHVEKMIIKTLIAGGIRFRAVRTVPEKTQRRERTLHRGGARHESALDAHRIRRQREAGGGNAGRPIWRGLVDHQSVGGIRLMHKVAE